MIISTKTIVPIVFVDIITLVRGIRNVSASSIEFTVNVKPAKDFPLDLYFVMDLSNSMKDTLDTLKENVEAMSKSYNGIYITL